MSNEDQKIDEALEDDQVSLESQADEVVEMAEAEVIGADADDREALLIKIAELENALVDAKEQTLRTAAEMQNVRRRAEQDVEKAHKFGVERFVNALLPVVDNLERALEASQAEGADPEALNEGVSLTLKTFIDALKGHKVEPVAPEGEPFDPALHQAISAIEHADSEPNTVLNVVQKGYTLHGRLVRPAMVVVSKAPAA